MPSERPTRVLVADDEAGHRWLLRLALEDAEDFTVVAEACNGAEAVSRAAQEQPDVVLLDLEMPGQDGLSIVAGVRSAAPEAQVILITAYPDEPGLAARARASDVRVLDKAAAVLDLTDRLRALTTAV